MAAELYNRVLWEVGWLYIEWLWYNITSHVIAMASSDSIKRERKGNFSDGELSLVEHYAQHAAILQSKLSNAVTNKRKQQIWEGIATAVNARGTDRRTVAELKKKWAEMKSASLRILSERRNRGS